MIIRSETVSDIEPIAEVTIAAFRTLPIRRHTEQFVINALRAAKALTLSLVAEIGGRVVGHIAFSPVTISDGSLNWYGLGPVSSCRSTRGRALENRLSRKGYPR
jgi:putative acetyltransferase